MPYQTIQKFHLRTVWKVQWASKATSKHSDGQLLSKTGRVMPTENDLTTPKHAASPGHFIFLRECQLLQSQPLLMYRTLDQWQRFEDRSSFHSTTCPLFSFSYPERKSRTDPTQARLGGPQDKKPMTKWVHQMKPISQ